MKKVFATLFSLAIGILLTPGMFAQSPEKMSYQAIIRNSSNSIVTNTSVGMQISVLKGSVGGTAVYVERQFPITNSNGLVSLVIGSGTLVSGSFSTINWADGTYYIKTETDLNGGTNYTLTGTSQLLSVPYAFHAKTADLSIDKILYIDTVTVESDPIFSAWDRNYNDLTNIPSNLITSEKDPVFSAWNKNYTDLTNIPAVPSSVVPRIAGKGQKLSVSFSGGDDITFSQSSSTCPNVYADVILQFAQGSSTVFTQGSSTVFTQGSTTIIYPTNKYFIDSKRFDAIFDIPSYVPTGLYDIILGPSTPCQYNMSSSFKID